MLYDTIGMGYIAQRLPDPRIASLLHSAIGGAESVVNVGAGTGSYEPTDRPVIAVEPSMIMIRHVPRSRRRPYKLWQNNCHFATAAHLLSQRYSPSIKGLQELGRIARDCVAILTWDPSGAGFWLTDEYFPEITKQDHKRFPAISEISRAFGAVEVRAVPVPHDCIDGFLGAYWRRPHAYLDPAVRSGMSGFAGLPGLDDGLFQLRRDLESGEWTRRFGHILNQDNLDIGYRLVIARVQ
jgi:hypothetical protein